MPQTPTPTPPRRPTAAPALQLTLEFDKFASFVSEYSGLLSLQGMFLKTHRLAPVGSQVAFELKLADGFSLCRGSGQVEWLRPIGDGAQRPEGMGVRFRTLDEEGRQLMLRILEEQVKGGGAPFELGQVPPDAVSDPELSRRMLQDQDATLISAVSEQKTLPPRSAPAKSAPAAPAKPAVSVPKPPAPTPKPVPITPVTSVKPAAPIAPAMPMTPAAVPDDFRPPWEKLPELPEEMLEPLSSEPAERPAPKTQPPSTAELEDPWAGRTSLFDDTAVGSWAASGHDLEALEGALDTPSEPDDELEGLSFDLVPEPDVDLEATAANLELAALGSPPAAAPAPVLAPPALTPPALTPPASAPPAAVPPGPLPDLVLPKPMTAAEQAMRHPGFRAETAKPAPPPASRSFLDEPDDLDITSTTLSPPPASRPAPVSRASTQPGSRPEPEPTPEWNPTPWREEAPSAAGVRGKLQSWAPHLLAAVLVLAVFGLVYVFRGSILELLGMGPETTPAVTQAPQLPAQRRPAPPPAVVPSPPPAEPSADTEPEPAEIAQTETVPAEPMQPAPVEPPPPPPPAPPVAVAPSRAATQLDRISFQQAEGATQITLRFDGQLGAARYRNSRLDFAEPRELFVLQGIAQPYAQSQITVGTPEVARIRTGHHRKPGGDELHVVLDLASATARVSAVRDLGDRLEIELRRR